jgi:hypothetical protein
MNIFKLLFKKYQAYKDRKFKERLERVFKTNAINAPLVIKGDLLVKNSVYMYVPEEQIEKFEEGVPIKQIFHKV